MFRTLDILMAGLIAGIVAFTTSQLGIGGTILGAVLGSMLYQLMSHFVKEPVENVRTQKIEREIFYVFPLIIILCIEVINLLSNIYLNSEQIIFYLESATGNNLFKFMGLGLIIMGFYPIIQPEKINKLYGYILLVVGVIKLLAGFVDINSPVVMLYAPLFYQLNEVISLAVIAAILYVIYAYTRESLQLYKKDKGLYKKDKNPYRKDKDQKILEDFKDNNNNNE